MLRVHHALASRSPYDRTVIEREAIERARDVIAGRLHRTPMLSCRSLAPKAYLKAELFQKTGSFKPRGMLNKIASLSPDERARGIVTWSAGNAAQGAAFAAAEAGVECTVFMWASANPLKVAATRGYGADVNLDAASPAEAHERLLAYVEETGRVFVHPFDDPVLQAGHGTLGLEVVEDVPDVATLVVPIGGGGLIAGVASAVDCRVVGVEPEQAPSLTAALEAGEPVRIEPGSIADGLNAPFTGRGNARGLSRARRRGRARERGRDSRRNGLSVHTREAGVRAGGCRCGGGDPRGEGRDRGRSDRRRDLGRERGSESRGWYPGQPMKADIHPDYVLAHVTCSCGNEFWTRSTKEELHVEICSECHPFYTGKQKLVDTGGRVERFQRRLEKAGARQGTDD